MGSHSSPAEAGGTSDWMPGLYTCPGGAVRQGAAGEWRIKAVHSFPFGCEQPVLTLPSKRRMMICGASNSGRGG